MLGGRVRHDLVTKQQQVTFIDTCCCLVTKSCLTLPPNMGCQAPLSVGFFQTRILERIAISSSRGSP